MYIYMYISIIHIHILHMPYVYMYLTSTYTCTSTCTCISEMSMNWVSVWWGWFVCLYIKDALASSPMSLSTCCPRWTSLLIVYLIFRGLITAIKRARWPNSHEYPSMNNRPFRAIKDVQNYFRRDGLNRLFYRSFIDMVQNLTPLTILVD